MSSSQPSSNYKRAARCLLSRGVKPTFVRWTGEGIISGNAGDEEGGKRWRAASAGQVAMPFLAALGCDSPRNAESLASVFAAAHKSEKAFDRKLFGALAKCVATASGGAFRAVRKTKKLIVLTRKEHDIPTKPWLAEVDEDGTYVEFALRFFRNKKLPKREGSVIEGRPEPDHSVGICRRRAPDQLAARRVVEAAAAAAAARRGNNTSDDGERSKGGATAAAGGPDDDDDDEGACEGIGVDGEDGEAAPKPAAGAPLELDQRPPPSTGDSSEDDSGSDSDEDDGDGDCDCDYETPSASADGEWKVVRVLGAVELKLHSACPEPLRVITNEKGGVRGVNEAAIKLDKEHGPLAQALLYALGLVLWDRAALGLDLPRSLPVAVVAVRKVSDSKRAASAVAAAEDDEEEVQVGSGAKPATRWLRGNLVIPELCGGRFFYSVEEFGTFEGSPGTAALGAYLAVMSEGLLQALKWLDLLGGRKGRVPPPRSMTGTALSFPGCDDQTLARFSIVSSPVGPTPDAHFRISQGEMFRAELDLRSLYTANVTTEVHADPVYWCSDGGNDLPEGDASVLVKVTSNSCYGLVTDGQGFLYQISSYFEDWPDGRLQQILRLLKDSLHAVYVPVHGSGIVQIMPDLHRVGFQQLLPSETLQSRDAWVDAWTAFKTFVMDVLIPLAECKVIHVDVRPGFDATANILYHPSDLKMRLVDLDSLVLFRVWPTLGAQVGSLKLITAEPRSSDPQSALEYVLWQVICVAETWLSGTLSKDVEVRPIIYSNRDRVNSLLAASPSSSYDRQVILDELERYDKVFVARADDLARRVAVAAAAAAAAAATRVSRDGPAVADKADDNVSKRTRSKRKLSET